MSYARRHSTNVCPGNRVRYIPRSSHGDRHHVTEPDELGELVGSDVMAVGVQKVRFTSLVRWVNHHID